MQANLKEVTAPVEDALRDVAKIKSMVSEAVEDGMKSAMKAVEQGRAVAEDAVVEARRRVHENPFQAMGVVFAAGVLTGSVLAWLISRRD